MQLTTINVSKSKDTLEQFTITERPHIIFGDSVFEEVDCPTYLGSNFPSNGQGFAEIDNKTHFIGKKVGHFQVIN